MICETDDILLIESEEWELSKNKNRLRNIKLSKKKAVSRRNKSRDKGIQYVWSKNRFYDNGKKTKSFNELISNGYNEPALNTFSDTAKKKTPRFRYVDCGYDNNRYSAATKKRIMSCDALEKEYFSGSGEITS